MVDFEEYRFRFEQIIIEYIQDETIVERLKSNLSSSTVRGILYELSKNKSKDFIEEDKEFLQYMFFCFG